MDWPWTAANENGTLAFIDDFAADKGGGMNAEARVQPDASEPIG